MRIGINSRRVQKVYGCLLAVLVIVLSGVNANAWISLTASGTYTQNFDTLSNAGTANVWTNDTTIAGWYSNRTVYRADTGSSTTGAMYSYGASASTDRALGSLGSGTVPLILYGVEFLNNTSGVITFDLLSYIGEQWRVASTTPNTLEFSYQISSSPISIDSGTWVDFNSLDFVSPTLSSTAAAGGTAPLSTASLSQSLNVSLSAGQYIMFRWSDTNDAGNDQGLAIDDFSLTYSLVTSGGDLNWGTAGSGGNGTWTQTGGNFWNGGAWDSNSKGIFGGSSGAVAVSGTVEVAAGLKFETDGYVLSGGEIAFTSSNAVLNSVETANSVMATINSVLSGSNGLTKTGDGTLVLGGANTFSGTFALNGGTLQISSDSNLGAASNPLVFGGGTLKTLSSIGLGSGRNISGSGAFDIAGGTTLTANGAFNTTTTTLTNTGILYLAGTTRNVGNLNFSAAGTLDGSDVITASGLTATNLTSGTATIAQAINLGAANVTIDVGSGGTVLVADDLTYGSAAANYFTKTGAGVLELAGLNNAITRIRLGSGSTTGGTIRIWNSSGAGQNQMYFNYGTLEAMSDLTGVNALSIGLSIGGRDGQAAILAGQNMEFNGAMGLFETGGFDTWLTVNNVSTFNGALTQSTTAGSGFVVAGSGTAIFNGDASGMTRMTTVKNASTLVINNSWGSSVVVESGGFLKGTGSIAGVVVSEGNQGIGAVVGTQTMQNGATYLAGASVEWKLVSNKSALDGTAGTDFDQFIVSAGDLSIDSTADISLVFNSAGSTVNWSDTFWSTDHSWNIFDGTGAIAGMFGLSDPSTWLDSTNTLLSVVRSQAGFSLTTDGSDVILVYTATVPEPGTIGLLLGGLGVIAWGVRRRSQKSA